MVALDSQTLRNGKGYEVATRWRAKFSHISPVWFQLRAGGGHGGGDGFVMSGQHDVDKEWMQALRVLPHQVLFCRLQYSRC